MSTYYLSYVLYMIFLEYITNNNPGKLYLPLFNRVLILRRVAEQTLLGTSHYKDARPEPLKGQESRSRMSRK